MGMICYGRDGLEFGRATVSGKSADLKPVSAQFHSWKEIAAYFRRDVRTVQRWEKDEGLPVHRSIHSKLSSIYAH
jgi:hypothetical protein